MTYELRLVTSQEAWRFFHEIRRTALFEAVGKYNVYIEDHPDDHRSNNHPLLMYKDGYPIATVRLDELGQGLDEKGFGAIRLVAVHVDWQRQGHGRHLSRLTESYARDLLMNTLYVNAAPSAVGYYKKMGWEHYIWNISELEGMAGDCVQMRKELLQ
jgi:GNAT superfamily N-acetyltransferase